MRILSCLAGIGCFFLMAAGAHGQAAAEYGAVTAATSTAGTSLKPPPIPTLKLPLGNSAPASKPSAAAGPGTVSSAASSASEKTEATAKNNLKFFEDHAGVDAADVTVTTAPDHAQAWVDDRYVGAAPLTLKLDPGHHRVFVSGANSSESFREFELTAKQTQTIDLKLKSGYQGGITVQGASPTPAPK